MTTVGPSSPNSLTDAIRNSILYQLNNIHTAFPGVIVDYDFTKKQAIVQPTINKMYSDGLEQPFPLLNAVPVIFPFAGGASLTFPVNAGDPCLLIVCERSIDQWMTTGMQTFPADPRKFDLSDAVAIMGLVPFTSTSPAPNNTDVLLTYQGSSISIKQNGDVIIDTSSKVAIGNNTTEVLDVISQLLGLLQGAMVMGPAFNGPLNASFIANVLALQTQLNAIKGSI